MIARLLMLACPKHWQWWQALASYGRVGLEGRRCEKASNTPLMPPQISPPTYPHVNWSRRAINLFPPPTLSHEIGPFWDNFFFSPPHLHFAWMVGCSPKSVGWQSTHTLYQKGTMMHQRTNLMVKLVMSKNLESHSGTVLMHATLDVSMYYSQGPMGSELCGKERKQEGKEGASLSSQQGPMKRKLDEWGKEKGPLISCQSFVDDFFCSLFRWSFLWQWFLLVDSHQWLDFDFYSLTLYLYKRALCMHLCFQQSFFTS